MSSPTQISSPAEGTRIANLISDKIKELRYLQLKPLIQAVLDEAYDVDGNKLTSRWIATKINVSQRHVRRIAKNNAD